MDKAKLMQRLMGTFVEELGEHVRALNHDLLALEKNPQDNQAERFVTLFRTAHSLKGAARSVNVTVIETACHHLETIMEAVRDGHRPLNPELFALLFATADAIEEAGMRLREQQDLHGAPLANLLGRLEAEATASTPGSPSAAAHPTPRAQPAPREAASPPAAREERPPSVPPAPEKPAPVPVAAPALPAGHEALVPEAGGVAATVRVSAEKLDAFLARSGEMLVARRRVLSRIEELLALRDFVANWRNEWRGLEKALGKLLPREENEPRALPSRTGLAGASRSAVAERGKQTTEDLLSRALPSQNLALLGRAGNYLRRLEKELDRLASALAGDGRFLEQAGRSLDDEVRRVRMLPFADACQGLDRMVRDLARATHKEVDLVIEGGAVELDRSVLEGLKDPLRHLVRNAVDHGAETPEKRQAAGKSPQARITVAAILRGAQVEVVVADDGKGIDLEALREQARKRRIPEPPDERELARIIFLPGLSTAKIITDVSGRGVGMDVVKSQVEALHGTVDLSWAPGKGTSFTLALPLTLTTLRALLLEAGGQTFAFVSTNVHNLVRATPEHFRTIEGRQMLTLGGPPLPVASLAETLGLPTQAREGGKVPVLIVAAAEKRMAFIIDEFLTEQEIVIKGLGARIRRLAHISGATILPSGKIALVLNAANLIRTAQARAPVLAAPAPQGETRREGEGGKKRILIAEDSVTTRTLEKSILEAAGYDVTVAVDGADAWQTLQEHGTDLLVSDVDMPRMDGFALAEAVRQSKRFQDLPIVLVTSRQSEQDKARGIEVEADAYLVKSAFDQKNLLEAIAQLI